MAGGRVVVLGQTGRNFAAGMSGGIAYVLDRDGDFGRRCNHQMVDLEAIDEAEDLAQVQRLIGRHVQHTGSQLGARVLQDWEEATRPLVKTIPRHYKRVLEAEARAAAAGRNASFTELVGVGVSG